MSVDTSTDLVLLELWITEDRGYLASCEDVLRVLQWSGEGMPPLRIEWLIAPIFYRLNLRNSEPMRQLAH